jgi:hypothetical protein
MEIFLIASALLNILGGITILLLLKSLKNNLPPF